MSSILKVDTIQDSSGNNIINESGDTITIGASGDTTNIVGTLQNNGASVGGSNTPLFSVKCGTFNISNSTMTKIQFDTESGNFFDPSGVFDTSNNRVTPSSTGYYLFGCAVTIKDVGDGKKFQMQLPLSVSNCIFVIVLFAILNVPHLTEKSGVLAIEAPSFCKVPTILVVSPDAPIVIVLLLSLMILLPELSCIVSTFRIELIY